MQIMETNFEHYKDELMKMAILTSVYSCEFKKKNVLKVETCASIGCDNCNIKVRNWLDQPYEEPVIEIDWSKVPVDTPVIAMTDGGAKFKRHFAKYFDGLVYVFDSGATSWSAPALTETYMSAWDKAELAREEDVEKYKK